MIETVIFFIVTFFDAKKDGIEGRGDAPWGEWHYSKWIEFYLPFGYMVGNLLWRTGFAWDSFALIGADIAICHALWKSSYRFYWLNSTRVRKWHLIDAIRQYFFDYIITMFRKFV